MITASEVQIAVALSGLDAGGLPVLGPEGLEPEQWWLEQVTLRQLAGDGEVYQPSTGEVRDRVERLIELGSEDERLEQIQARLGVDRTGLDAWVHGRLVVERYVLRNLSAWSRDATTPEQQREAYRGWLDDVKRGVAVRRIARVGAGRPADEPLGDEPSPEAP